MQKCLGWNTGALNEVIFLCELLMKMRFDPVFTPKVCLNLWLSVAPRRLLTYKLLTFNSIEWLKL